MVRVKGQAGSEAAGGLGIELPMEEERAREALLEEAEAGDDAGPSPAFVADFEDVDLEYVARLRTADGDWAGERVDEAAVDVLELGDGHAGMHLRAAGIHALEVHRIAGGDGEPRRKRGVPARVGRRSAEGVFGHC